MLAESVRPASFATLLFSRLSPILSRKGRADLTNGDGVEGQSLAECARLDDLSSINSHAEPQRSPLHTRDPWRGVSKPSYELARALEECLSRFLGFHQQGQDRFGYFIKKITRIESVLFAEPLKYLQRMMTVLPFPRFAAR